MQNLGIDRKGKRDYRKGAGINMAVTWTEEQQRVIDTREQNILVSAAAGSGKTAVLVARILARITDSQKPIDIDRLLIVTFTNAAASEMRERIRDAIEQKAEEEPENMHLQRQLVLVHNAKITTIHSFCLQVLRDHFQLAGIDPSFRIADQGEILLLEQECVKETIADAYEHMTSEFEQFLEMTATGKNDTVIENLILQLYHFAMGQPWPKLWMEQCTKRYQEWKSIHESEADVENFSHTETPEEPEWLLYIAEETTRLLLDVREKIEEAIQIAGEKDGPYLYQPALEDDLSIVDRLLRSEDYHTYAEAFRTMRPYTALSRKKDETISPLKKQQVQDMRQEVKDTIADIRKHYYYNQTELLREEFEASGVLVRVLTQLTEQFMDRLSQKKTEKNILDFGDLEHLALKVLVKRTEALEETEDSDPLVPQKKQKHENDGIGQSQIPAFEPTAAALEYAEQFEEIMIDEYQDSNLIQELVLASVAGRGKGEANRFMVGDVKQSIYRFRLARPELFMEKYKTYQNGRPQDCRIDLHKNFRSRAEVLEGINEIFRQIMTENPGGVVYDKDAALYPGAVFEKKTDTSSSCIDETKSLAEHTEPAVEMWLLDSEGSERIREEARMVGQRIRALVGKELVWDKEQSAYRPAKYSDIVILLRTVSGWAESFGEVLSDMGIPNVTSSQTGYFSAAEVRVILSYLQILDNPMQDIPLAAAMRSAIGGFTDEELAQIRIYSGKQHFYDCCMEYLKEPNEEACEEEEAFAYLFQELKQGAAKKHVQDTALKEKLQHFFDIYSYLRGKCAHTPMHLLLWEILEITGYGEYAAALPAGNQRKANLDMLVEKAIAYESTSYRGLYHFVRYIENLKKYDVDFGEASIASEAENTVRLLSIHKSKGLEFPIVFVSGMGKQFNDADSRSKVVLHPEYGIGCDFVDVENRIREATLLKKVIQQTTKTENLGEELRVLYVAMTRAKEKLILTGTVRSAESRLIRWNMQAGYRGITLSYSCLSSASSYLDWVMPVLLRHPCASLLLAQYDLPEHIRFAGRSKDGEAAGRSQADFALHLISASELEHEEENMQEQETLSLQTLLHLNPELCYDQETKEYLTKVFQSAYRYETDQNITGKLSVSELKKNSYLPEETDAEELYQEEEIVPLVPKFCMEETKLVGAARGTVYHTFMENLDYSKKDALEMQLEELISCGKMAKEEAEVLCLTDIRRFLASRTGRKMTEAFQNGRLFRERPFVLGVPANEIHPEWNQEETVLVQGMIDAYFYEEDGTITLVDYKTDRVPDLRTLGQKYHAQLAYYADALERLTGRKVQERVIYSFYLGREIKV